MNSKIGAMLQDPWLTKKRKMMLIALIGFAACSSVLKITANVDGERSSTSSIRGPYVRAGGLICNDMISAHQLYMQERNGINLTVNGCRQISSNSNLYVEVVLWQNHVVKVRNANGTAWVTEDDIVQ